MRNHKADRTCRQTMHWCPLHAQAWCFPVKGPPQWIPLTAHQLRVALAWASAWGCAAQITVEVTPCPQCQEAA